jgi:proline dehydrogenase
MHLERQRAQQLGYQSPIWDSLQETHACYNSSVAALLQAVAQRGAEVMVASHNQASIELAVAEMARLGLEPGKAGGWRVMAAVPACLPACLPACYSAGMLVLPHHASLLPPACQPAAAAVPPAGVYFGQLLGMSDNLTIPLGKARYSVYKYVCYGPVALVMPYLVRRAQENSGMMAGLQAQVAQLRRELLRRATGRA